MSNDITQDKPADLATKSDIDMVLDLATKERVLAKYHEANKESQQANALNRGALSKFRYIGEWLRETELHNGDPRSHDATRLSDLGINKSQSSRWQKLAIIPSDVWETELDKREMVPSGITAKSMLSIAKRYEANTSEQIELVDGCRVDDLHSHAETGVLYDAIYADPPWSYDNKGTRATADDHYSTMSIEDIAALPVGNLSADKSLLFVWTTNAFIQDTLTTIIPAWGFEFKSSIVWVKPQIGMGNYVRCAHEFLLIATRGGRTGAVKNQISWLEHKRGKHSSKPHAFREIVERVTGPGNYLELFGREHRPGWSVWGNEVSRQKFLEAV